MLNDDPFSKDGCFVARQCTSACAAADFGIGRRHLEGRCQNVHPSDSGQVSGTSRIPPLRV